MKRFLSFLTTLTFLTAPFITQATTVSSGDLIKASGPTIYYLGADQKRYVFPTDKTYFSWYTDFSGVKTISDADLASYMLGGNVTYRPGTKMIKITTDPKVYAVDKQGTLRWIQTEQIATSLYGIDWAKKIDDVPDAFFVNYKIGTTIASMNDFAPNTVQSLATSINLDKQLIGELSPAPTPPAPSPSPTPANYNGSITASKTQPKAGELIQVTGIASPGQGINALKLFFDNTLLKNCGFSPCASDLVIPVSGTKASYDLRAEIQWIGGQYATASSVIAPNMNTSSSVDLTLTRSEVRPGQALSSKIIVSSDFNARFIDLYVDDVAIRGCDSQQQCQFSYTENSPVGTIHGVYAIARDSLGNARRSPTKTLMVVDNDHPGPSVTTNKTILPMRETLEVTVTGSDDDGIFWTEIWLNNNLMKHCAAPTCNLLLGPWNQPQILHLSGVAQDFLGLAATSTPLDIPVQ